MGAQALSSRAIIGEFYNRLEQNAGVGWIDLGMYFTSDQAGETYKWLGQAPAMREWVGGRNAKGFRDNGITIANLHYEATMEVKLEEIRRDKTGQVMVRVREMADRANAHWAKLMSTLILNGESTVCYDGQYFFDTDHAEGDSGTQDNDITVDISALDITHDGTTTAPSATTMQMAILQSIQQMYSFKDDQGEPMNEGARSFLVMVPIPYWHAAQAAVTSPIIDGGDTNVIANLGLDISVVANPRLTWTDKFAVFRRDGNVKPFIRQEEKMLELSALAEGSEEEFKNNRHLYGIDTWRNVGYGYWQHAVQTQLI